MTETNSPNSPNSLHSPGAAEGAGEHTGYPMAAELGGSERVVLAEHFEQAQKRIAELERQFEQFAQDIAVKLGIAYTPPVAKGECAYLEALENLSAERDRLKDDLHDAEAWAAVLESLLEKALPIIEAEADQRDKAGVEHIGGYWTEMRELADEISTALRPADGAAESQSPWRPIETAPKDGTMILLYPKKGEGHIATGYWHKWGSENGLGCGDECWAVIGGCWFEIGEVSHWMPIPEAPESEAKQCEK